MDNSWTKLKNGKWGGKIIGTPIPHVGQKVRIFRKDHTESTEEVEKVLWSGLDKSGETITLVAIKEKQPVQNPAYQPSNIKGKWKKVRYCSNCGENEDTCACEVFEEMNDFGE